MTKRIILFLLLPLSLFAWKMESGTVQLNNTYNDSNWVNVTLQQTYATPPLIFSIPTEKGADPLALRIQNVTTTGFDILQVEPSAEDGPHAAIVVNYIAIDSGEHYLPDGTKIIASKLTTKTQQAQSNVSVTEGWDSISFASPFSDNPVVLGMIQGVANETGNPPSGPSVPFLTTTISDVTTSGFKIALERSEVVPGDVNNSETIAYLAIESNRQGTFTDESNVMMKYETIRTLNVIKGWEGGCTTVDYNNTYSVAPNVIASKQTHNGGDGGWMRVCKATTSTSVYLSVDEDRYRDTERAHIEEVGGVIVFGQNFTFDSSIYASVVEYRMDECFWLGSGTFDVADIIASNNAESYNASQPDASDAKVCSSGAMSVQGYIQAENLISIGTNWSYALWVKFPLDTTGHDSFVINGTNYYYHALGSIVGTGDMPALLMENGGTDIAWELYDANGDDIWADLPDDLASTNGGWHHFVFVQTAGEISLYLDGAFYNKIVASITGDVEAFLTSFDGSDTQTVGTKVDELKLYDYVLSPDDVNRTYQNENSGKNSDSSPRTCSTCSAYITGGSWELIGIPADLRTETNTSITKILGDDIAGIYGTDWRIYIREYSDNNNSSWYTYLSDINTPLVFGKAYWLGSKNTESWDVNDMQAVDYNSADPACTAGTCVEIDLKAISLDEGDDLNGTGPYRYNMTGFTGRSPVDWADCRFIINGTVYTPSDAETAGYVNKQIWQYNLNSSDADAKGYTTCDDVTPGSCQLVPYKGFWIELHGKIKNKTVKLLIPKE